MQELVRQLGQHMHEVAVLSDKIGQAIPAVNDKMEQLDKLSAELAGLRAKRDEVSADIAGLQSERGHLQDVVKELRERLKSALGEKE
jgi:chromosome segregation ATPase